MTVDATTTTRRIPPNPAVPTPSQSTSASSSIFLRKKKPTVAHIGSRPLLRPFTNTAIDYNNPAKFDPVPVKPTARGTAISTPGSTPSSGSASPIITASPVINSTTPFTFDNHTPESKANLTATSGKSTKTLRESPSQSFRKRAGSFDPPTTSQTNDEGLTILRIKRRRNEEPLDTLGNQSLSWTFETWYAGFEGLNWHYLLGAFYFLI